MDSLVQGRVGLFVRLKGKPGSRAALLDSLHRYMDRIGVEEPGTEAFMLLLDPSDADIVWLHEWFTDEAAQMAHRSSAAFSNLMHEMEALLAGPPAVVQVDPLRVLINDAADLETAP
jgi:quinol monooxygenase YgiN